MHAVTSQPWLGVAVQVDQDQFAVGGDGFDRLDIKGQVGVMEREVWSEWIRWFFKWGRRDQHDPPCLFEKAINQFFVSLGKSIQSGWPCHGFQLAELSNDDAGVDSFELIIA